MHHLLLLHGAIGSKDQFRLLEKSLQGKYIIHSINFSGHGGRPFPHSPFSIPLFADDVLQFLRQSSISQVYIFGYSLGGYVAMYLAKHYPGLVRKVVTLATKFNWDEEIAAREGKMLDSRKIEEKIPAFAKQLKQRHAPVDWKEVLKHTQQFLLQLGEKNTLELNDYDEILIPCLLLLGENDKMVTKDETLAVSQQLPDGGFMLLKNTPHPLEQVDISLLSGVIKRFLG